MPSSAISSRRCLQSPEAFNAGPQYALLSHNRRRLEGVLVPTEQLTGVLPRAIDSHLAEQLCNPSDKMTGVIFKG
jgi:hypothetical protein